MCSFQIVTAARVLLRPGGLDQLRLTVACVHRYPEACRGVHLRRVDSLHASSDMTQNMCTCLLRPGLARSTNPAAGQGSPAGTAVCTSCVRLMIATSSRRVQASCSMQPDAPLWLCDNVTQHLLTRMVVNAVCIRLRDQATAQYSQHRQGLHSSACMHYGQA